MQQRQMGWAGGKKTGEDSLRGRALEFFAGFAPSEKCESLCNSWRHGHARSRRLCGRQECHAAAASEMDPEATDLLMTD